MNKVVKCKNDKCAQYFMHTEKDTKCPFCYIEYGEAVRPESDSDTSSEKEEATNTKKGAFKIKIVKDKDN